MKTGNNLESNWGIFEDTIALQALHILDKAFWHLSIGQEPC